MLPDAVVDAARLVAEVLDTSLAKSLSRSLRPCWPYEEVRLAKDRLVASIVTFEAEFAFVFAVILLLLLGSDTGDSTRLFAPMCARLGEAVASTILGLLGEVDRLRDEGSEEKVDPTELHEFSDINPELEPTDLGEVVEAGGAVLRAGVDEHDREGGIIDDAASEVDSAMMASLLLPNPFTLGIPKGLLAPPELPGLLLLLLFLPLLLSPKKRDILKAGAGALPVNDEYDSGLKGEVVDVANVTVCTTWSFVAAADDDDPAYDRGRELLAVRACPDCSANSS